MQILYQVEVLIVEFMKYRVSFSLMIFNQFDHEDKKPALGNVLFIDPLDYVLLVNGHIFCIGPIHLQGR